MSALERKPDRGADFGDCITELNKAGIMEETCTLRASLDGLVQACYALGAILSLPFVPMFNDRFGRRWSIFFGSAVSIAGAIIQGFAQNGI